MASAARLKKGVYSAASSKALVAQLQGVVASLEEPSSEMAQEMREQMEPRKTAMEELTAAVEGKKAMISEVKQEVLEQQRKVTEAKAKNEQAAKKREGERGEIREAINGLVEQVEGVRSGTKLKEAMETLKKTIGDEKVAMRTQVTEMEERLDDAKTKLKELDLANKKVESGAPAQCDELVKKGQAYASAGKYKYA